MRELKEEELEMVRGGSLFGSLMHPALTPMGVANFTMKPSMVVQLESLKLKIQQDLESGEFRS